jgi:hypothetical protein
VSEEASDISRESVLRRFSSRLESVRLYVGKPSYAKLQAIVNHLRPSTMSTVLRGETNPTLDFVLHFVRACATFARRAGHPINHELVDEDAWRNNWLQVQRQLGAIRRKTRRNAESACLLRPILMLAWAYHRLPPDSQAVFRVLCLHHTPDLDLSTASSLLNTTLEETRRQLDLLVAADLAERTGEHHYRLEDPFVDLPADFPAQDQGDQQVHCQSCPTWDQV